MSEPTITFTPEQQAHIDGLLSTAQTTAVDKFKTEAETARKAAVPEKYELKPSDGTALDPTDVDAIAAFARENEMSIERATSLLKHSEGIVAGLVDRQAKALTAQSEKWLQDAQADPEIGGDKWNATLASAKRAMDKLAPGDDHPFRKMLNETGYGNHPEWIKAIRIFGQFLAEDRLGPGPSSGDEKKRLDPNTPEGHEARAKRMFDKSKT